MENKENIITLTEDANPLIGTTSTISDNLQTQINNFKINVYNRAIERPPD